MEFWIFVGVGIVALGAFGWLAMKMMSRRGIAGAAARSSEAKALAPKFQDAFAVHGEEASLMIHGDSGEVAVVPANGEAFVLPTSYMVDMRKVETSEDRTLPGFINTNESRYIKRIDVLIKLDDARVETVIVPIYTKGSRGRDLEKGIASARQDAANLQAQIYQALSGDTQAAA